jgi:hypothetical protein
MLNTPAARIDSLPPLYGGGGGMTPGGSTPASTRDHQAPKFIVGNALAGDTIDVCDYLDVGDGVQLQAALNAAAVGTPRQDVWLRPGVITTATTITVPPQVTLRGAGILSSRIAGTATNRTPLATGNRSLIADLYISVPVPSAGAVGTEVLRLGGLGSMERCRVLASQPTAPQAANETLTALVRFDVTGAGNASARIIASDIVGYSLRRLAIARDLLGIELFQLAAVSNFLGSFVQNCSVVTTDIGIDVRGPVVIDACEIQNISRIGVYMATLPSGRAAPIISNSYIATLALTGTPQFGVVADTGATASGLLDAKINGCTFRTTSVDAASTGIALQGTGDGVIVDGCSVAGFALGVNVSATQANVSAKGTIRGATTPVTDASGSLLNEMRVI